MFTRRTFLLAATAAMALPAAARASAAPQLLPVVQGLDHPWGMAFLPDGNVLVTERSARLRLVSIKDSALSAPLQGLPDIAVGGQGGLLGIALAPDFATSRLVFLSFARPVDGGSATAVFRARLSADAARLEDGKVIFTQTPAGSGGQHFGSRLVFGRDGHLFVTTGDRGALRAESQNPANHIGKILRITIDGAPAPGNPALPGWAPEVWSIGHRNVQSAALNPATGELWTVEHGARGGDEVNIPQAGKNYGWPVISYGAEYSGASIGEGTAKAGMEQPLHYWDPSIAPSGMAFLTGNAYPAWKGSLFIGALAGAHIHRLTLADGKVTAAERLFDGFGRFRDVAEAPDGRLYALVDASEPDGGLYVIAAQGEVTSDTGN